MKFRDLREQIERTQPPIIIDSPTPPRLDVTSIDAAVSYIKGYCNKHPNCSERCRLYDIEGEHCMFFDTYGILGLPCDWEMPKREGENGEK